MIVIFLLIPLSILIATGFLFAFIWAVRSGQYEDTCTPAMRLLTEEAGKAKDSCAPNEGEAVAPEESDFQHP
jgi:cbb3-type cytochrome oxidase maturation protein